MVRKKRYPTLPKGLTYDKTRGAFKYRNTVLGLNKWLGRNQVKAISKAMLYNRAAEAKQLMIDSMSSKSPNLRLVIDQFIANQVPRLPWAESTARNYITYLRKYQRDIGDRLFAEIDQVYLGDYLSQWQSADVYNGHRYLLVQVWKYGIARGWAVLNAADMTIELSNSKKILANRRRRNALTLDMFKAIYSSAPQYMKIAMELSLVTLQSRNEICSINDADYRDGYLYVIRQKTKTQSDSAYIKIKSNKKIEELRQKALSDGLLCPYWVRRKPLRNDALERRQGYHPFWVDPRYLTKAFAKVRDSTEVRSKGVIPNTWSGFERPTFHEIRGLGSRLYEEAGYPKPFIKQLMSHSEEKTTDIYLQAGSKALSDDRYIPVEAPLAVNLGTSLKISTVP